MSQCLVEMCVSLALLLLLVLRTTEVDFELKEGCALINKRSIV